MDSTTRRPPGARRGRSTRWLALTVVGVAVALSGGAAVVVLREGPPAHQRAGEVPSPGAVSGETPAGGARPGGDPSGDSLRPIGGSGAPGAFPGPTSRGTAPTAGTPSPSTSPPEGAFPAPPAAPIAGFVAFGDSGAGPAQRAVAAAMESWAGAGRRVDALVTTGDNVYDFGEPRLFAAQLDEPYRALRQPSEALRQERPLWVTLGNHDVVRGHGPTQLRHLGLPDLPYARRLPGVRLLFLDGNRPDAAQASWLAAELSTPGPDLSVVVLHQPPYSCGPHGSTRTVVDQWVPVFEAYRVTLVLAGHDHLYSRMTSPSGTTYVVTGGGGRDLYAAREDCSGTPPVDALVSRHHFVGVELRDATLELSAVTTDGTVLDHVVLRPALGVPPGPAE